MTLRYVSSEEDSARWDGFAFRDGDVVVSSRSKHGTTWTQQVCLLLVYGSPLPGRRGELSPWLDHLVADRAAVFAGLAAQPGRRVVKTHTPLDGLPLDPRAHWVVPARHPLDAAVSLWHQGNNIDRRRLHDLTGAPLPTGPRPPLDEWLRRWVATDADPRAELDSLPGVMHHLSDAWARRDASNVHLVHYADLSADLDAAMRELAGRLGVSVPADRWAGLVAAASFARMRADAVADAPAGGVLADPVAFFRRGTSGAGLEVLGVDGVAAYERRAAQLADPDLLAWLHR